MTKDISNLVKSAALAVPLTLGAYANNANAATIDLIDYTNNIATYNVINDDQYGDISNVDFYGLSGVIGYELHGGFLTNSSIADINATGTLDTHAMSSFFNIPNGSAGTFSIMFDDSVGPLTLHDANVGNTSLGGLNAQYLAPTAVPVPASVYLFGTGLLGLAGVARRKKQE